MSTAAKVDEVVPEQEALYQDKELMEEFFVDFKEAHEQSTNVLIFLEKDPHNSGLINTLFRSVHTIKGNLIYVGLKNVSPLLQSVEDVLESIREGRLEYDSALSDVILLAMDRTKNMVKARLREQESGFSPKLFSAACKAISKIPQSPPSKRPRAIQDAILLLDPATQLPSPDAPSTKPKRKSGDTKPKTKQETATPPAPQEHDARKLLQSYGVKIDADMEFFFNLASPLEARSRYWRGRTHRLLECGLAMNDAANCPVVPTQLAAAIIMHDVGMAFLPLSILHKEGKLSAKEIKTVRAHPRMGFDLLRRLKEWEDAAEIVIQHHERIDGTGYPKGLTAMEICDGAKILAIIDTFDARTHERAHTTQLKRPFIRALLEINKCAGTQFSQKWVDVFNDIIRQLPQYQHIQ